MCGEQPLDPAFSTVGLAAEAELAVDDRAFEGALGGLLVGCTPSWAAKVQSAGHAFRRLRAR